MVTGIDTRELDAVFAALSHPVRRSILQRCGRQACTVVELAEPHALSLNAISKHIKSLEKARLVSREVDGNSHYIRARPTTLQPALDWLGYNTKLWEQSLHALKQGLEQGS